MVIASGYGSSYKDPFLEYLLSSSGLISCSWFSRLITIINAKYKHDNKPSSLDSCPNVYACALELLTCANEMLSWSPTVNLNPLVVFVVSFPKILWPWQMVEWPLGSIFISLLWILEIFVGFVPQLPIEPVSSWWFDWDLSPPFAEAKVPPGNPHRKGQLGTSNVNQVLTQTCLICRFLPGVQNFESYGAIQGRIGSSDAFYWDPFISFPFNFPFLSLASNLVSWFSSHPFQREMWGDGQLQCLQRRCGGCCKSQAVCFLQRDLMGTLRVTWQLAFSLTHQLCFDFSLGCWGLSPKCSVLIWT